MTCGQSCFRCRPTLLRRDQVICRPFGALARGGSGSMIISPRGEILASAEGSHGVVFADIDPGQGRQGGDAMNHQQDMRARLFRERNPDAFGILTQPNPPILEKIPIEISQQEAGRIAAEVLTIGEEEFRQAESLVRADKTTEVIEAFVALRSKYRGSWIDRVATERLKTLGGGREPQGVRPAVESAPN